MSWKKGQSGNPLGRLPGEKQFADQLRIVLAEPVDKNDPKSVRKLRRIAEKLVECALNGEPWAIAQVADRIDGKATAEIKTEQTQRYVVDRKSTRLNSSHLGISYAVFCLKKKKK